MKKSSPFYANILFFYKKILVTAKKKEYTKCKDKKVL